MKKSGSKRNNIEDLHEARDKVEREYGRIIPGWIQDYARHKVLYKERVAESPPFFICYWSLGKFGFESGTQDMKKKWLEKKD
jgi:hypothetical protein